jgi:hypothetical protein
VNHRGVNDPKHGGRPIPPCPACSSPDVLPFLYGEPMPDVKGSMLGMKPDDEVVIGGCLVDPDNPRWKCRACRHDFGRLGDDREYFEDDGSEAL